MIFNFLCKLISRSSKDQFEIHYKRKAMQELLEFVFRYEANQEFAAASQSCMQFFKLYGSTLDLLPKSQQDRLLKFMLEPKCRFYPQPRLSDMVDVDKTKDKLLALIEATDDPTLKQNALLQSLCKATPLGSIFHVQRHTGCFFSNVPSILSGRLKKIANLLTDMEIKEASAETKTALMNEQHRLQGKQPCQMLDHMKSKYPALYSKVLKLDPNIEHGPELDRRYIF